MPTQSDPIRRRQYKYDFAPYLNGEWWKFTPGEFTTRMGIKGAAYGYGRNYGYTVNTRADGRNVWLRFTKKAEQ